MLERSRGNSNFVTTQSNKNWSRGVQTVHARALEATHEFISAILITSGGFEGEISLNTMKNHSLFFVTSIPEYRKRHNLEFGLDLDLYFWNILDFCLDYRTRYFP